MSAMSRADDLAVAFEHANRELVDYLRALDREQWRARAVNSPILQVGDEDENRPVGTIAHHVASAYGRTAAGLKRLAAGEELPRPDPGRNVQHAAEHADPDPEETIALLEQGAADVSATIRALTGEQLDREVVTFIGPSTLAEFIQRAATFHPTWHLSSIEATFATRDYPVTGGGSSTPS
jgi:hypothetical protein